MSVLRMLSVVYAIALVALVHTVSAQTVITAWNFDGATSTTVPGGSLAPSPSAGSGSAHLVGLATSTGFNNGITGQCNAANGSCGWQTSTYPAQSTGSGSSGVEFRASTVGFEDVVLEYDHRASGTASRWSRIEYSTDGCTWNVLADNGGALIPQDQFHSFNFSLAACSECDNNPDFRVRIVSIFSPVSFNPGLPDQTFDANTAYHRALASGGSAYGPSGTWRFDNVTLKGNVVAEAIATGSISGVPVCVGNSITVPYTATGTFNGGNSFIAQLSDEFGCFGSPVVIGSVSSTSSGSIVADVPISVIAGNGYRVRVISTSPAIFGTPSGSTVTVNALPTVGASATETEICFGESTVLNGSGASSYTWDNGALNGVALAPSSNTTYTVTGTDGNGCENTASVAVTVNALPTVGASATETSLCAGESTVLTGSGASSYLWDNGAVNGVALAPSSNTTYTVTGTDGNGCENTASVAVTVNALPIVGASATETSLCAGESTVLTGSGASSYTWDNGAVNGVALAPSSNTTYTVIGTDGNGCENTASVAVTVNALPTVGASATETSLCAGESTVLTGSGASSYLWDNGAVNGVALAPSSNTTYTVIGTDGNGCENTASVAVTVNALPTVGASATETELCIGESTVLTGSGASSYTWDNGALNGVALAPSSNTTYTVIGTDGNGCENTASVAVTVNALPTVGASATETSFCAGESTVLTGSGASSYLWDNGAVNGVAISPASNTTYTVIGTDGNGCENTASVAVTVNALPTVGASATETALCAGESTVLTGSGASSYTWDNGALNGVALAPSSNTTYTVIGTDGNGCENTASVAVTVNALPTVGASATETSFCAGESTVLTGSGASSYLWDNGAVNGVAISPASNTTYTVIGTDGNGCENTASVAVTVNQLPSATITASGPTDLCPGAAVTLTADASVGYLWTTGSTDGAITVGSEGDYAVTVTDGNGCTNTSDPVEVNVFETVIAEVNASGPLTFCEGQSVTLTAPDGSGHLWSNGVAAQSITLDESTDVSVSLTDANGCASASAVVSVTVNPLPEVTVTANGPTTFCQGGSVSLEASAAASYLWTTGASTQSVTISTAQEVSVTVTDDNGCENTSANVQVTVNVPSQATITETAATVCPGESVTLTASAGSQFLWNTGEDDQSIVITEQGEYSVTVTDDDGCESSAGITIDEGAAVVAQLVVTGEQDLCAGETVTLSVSDAASFDGFLWSNGATSSSITVSAADDYSVTVYGSGACIPAEQVLGPVTVTVSSVVPQVSQNGNLLSVTNGPFASYQWFRNGNPIPGADQSTYEATTSGNYHVQVAAGGCVTVSPTVELTISVSIAEQVVSALAVWPNPSESGIFRLSEKVTGVVHSALGAVVADLRATDSIDLSAQVPGIYVLRTAEGAVLRLVR
jgi:hypothetical protein